MLQNINYFTIIYTFGGYRENKNRRNGEKSQKEGEGNGCSGSIVFWPSPPTPLHRTNMAGQKASLQAKNGRALQDIAKKGYTSESPRKKNWGMQATGIRCADESIQGYSGEVR